MRPAGRAPGGRPGRAWIARRRCGAKIFLTTS
ncbi:regulator of ribonuclease activity A [Burkholderia pseudomallei]|uniref:Regulator of ribonuclease activity A n=1 Tax=Burkholderia pseudomallei TaxID=28450 RepID=A0AAX0UF81_BURPE|nr:regulator of ribonuclease activity A [Burkholderia pseudomallei]AUL56591.1 regulator of ribonuclease activity A [Burkholderia pseudomallei]PJO67374.1 regulator of ribonuclease activity A [Burkholderia pseudomallei]PPF07166.1 regulator of ribonuclease activity A [Burkholderia pseudomallei]